MVLEHLVLTCQNGQANWGFLLQFQPGIHAVFEEAASSLAEMPDLVDVLDDVTLLHGFGQLRRAPSTSDGVSVCFR